jgi:flagellar basal body-associated protein FliL
MADKSPKDDTLEAGGAKAKKPPMLMIIIAVALIAVIVGAVVVVQVSASSKVKVVKKPEPGPPMPLDEFLVNLADPSGDHFVKVTMTLQLDKGCGKTPETLKDDVPQIRDAVLLEFSTKTREQLSNPVGRKKLKSELKQKINKVLGEPDVNDIFFTQFVTQ